MVEASCHCGAVRIEISEAPETVTECNCSICRRLGTLWAYYHPRQVKFTAGSSATDLYVWGDKTVEFHTCRTCGCTTHWQSTDGANADRMGVNARLLEPTVLEAARVRKFDGASS
jgi:hypothetical protein